jgi:hypothetical protein
MPESHMHTCGVYQQEFRDLPNEDLPGPPNLIVMRHYLGRVRFDMWQPPFKPGIKGITHGLTPEESDATRATFGLPPAPPPAWGEG